MNDTRLTVDRVAAALGTVPDELLRRREALKARGQRLFRAIAREHGIEVLQRAILAAHSLDPVEIESLREIEPSSRKLPPAMSVNGEAVEVGWLRDESVVVAMSDPTDLLLRGQIVRLLEPSPVRIAYLSSDRIRAYGATSREVEMPAPQSSFQQVVASEVSAVVGETNVSSAAAEVIAGSETGNKLLRSVFETADRLNGNDIHIDPYTRAGRGGVHIRFRVGGVLKRIDDLSIEGELGLRSAEIMARALKLEAGVDISGQEPTDFRVQWPLGGRAMPARVHTHPAKVNPVRMVTKTTIRLHKARRMELDKLGMNPALLSEWKSALYEGAGMLLISGPMGSGKSSTMFASVPLIVDEGVAACTIEDPVEFEVGEWVTQYEINARSVADRMDQMARQLLDIRRQDIDVAIVGEIRDKGSMELAFTLATAGIRVLATTHAGSAVHTLQKLLDWGLDPFIIASTLRGVLNLRLLQRLCEGCREPVTHDDERAWPTRIFGRELPDKGYRQNPSGCSRCMGVGTTGPFPIGEFLATNKVPLAALKSPQGMAALTRGMASLEDEAVAALSAGKTSVESVIRAQIGTTSHLFDDLMDLDRITSPEER